MWLVVGVVLLAVIVLGVRAWWARFDDNVSSWLEHVESGVRLKSDSSNQLKRDDIFIFLAERTKFRVLKYNNKFYTQASTFGTRWRNFESVQRSSVYSTLNWNNGKCVYDTVEEACQAVDDAVKQIKEYIDTSEYDDPSRWRKTVVATREVTEKVYY